MPSDFVHLHVHTEYSMLDGAAKLEPLILRAIELGQPALAITDHGNLYGAMDFHQTCMRHGLKPIIGMEAYVAPGHHTERDRVVWGRLEDDGRVRDAPGAYTHLTVLAQNSEGLRNLYRLHALSFTEGFYYKPRISIQAIAEHSGGLVVTTGCAGGEVATRLRIGDAAGAREAAGRLKDIFGDRAYVEVMAHGIPWEKELNEQLRDVAVQTGMGLVATNDSHYTLPGDAGTHDALLCLQTAARLSDQARFKFSGDGYFLRSRRDMELVGLPPEALDNTLLVAESVEGYGDLFDYSLRMPQALGDPEETDLRMLAYQGLERRRGGSLAAGDVERLEYELDTIIQMEYPDYFIVLADVIGEAKRRGIRIGPGRGSAGGSLVAYALGITDLDPIAHGLLFERFLNPQRKSLPDIDFDIDDTRRAELVRWTAERYGHDRTARIITYGRIKAKRALQDAARVLGEPYTLGKELTTYLPRPQFGRMPDLDTVDWTELPDRYQPTIELAHGLEGLVRNTGVHAAGIVISPVPLVEVLPVWQNHGKLDGEDDPLKDVLITGYGNPNTNPMIDKLGLVKMDFLGLRNLGIIDDTLRLLGTPALRLPLVDEECRDVRTYELLRGGHTLGVFQLDSPGMRGLLRRLRPDSLADIAAVNALYRPGPMGADAHTAYADRKNGRSRVEYPHPSLERPLHDILGPTYGLVVFQEQVLQTLNVVCGWSYSEAALLFDAMRKKLTEKMLAARPDYERAALGNGYSQEAVDALWDILVPFSDYSFNKAHATGYGLVGYWTAFLKANHPAEYMAALLTSVQTDPDKQAEYIAEVRRMGVPLLPPDVNDSGAGWSPVRGALRYGLASIKGVGDKAVAALAARRPYRGIDDFFRRADPKVLNAGVLAALVQAGALDSQWSNRNALAEQAGALASRALADREARHGGQGTLVPVRYRPSSQVTVQRGLWRQWERDFLGVELSLEVVHLRATRPLSDTEWEYVHRVVLENPGDQELRLSYRQWKMSARQRVTLSRRLTEALAPLGVIEVETE